MVTLESIIKKLGFNPLKYKPNSDGWTIDDNWDSPFKSLTDEELDFVFNAAISDPKCYAINRT